MNNGRRPHNSRENATATEFDRFSASDIVCLLGPLQFVRGAHGLVDQAATSGSAVWKLG
jgi:hypothetical protein